MLEDILDIMGAKSYIPQNKKKNKAFIKIYSLQLSMLVIKYIFRIILMFVVCPYTIYSQNQKLDKKNNTQFEIVLDYFKKQGNQEQLNAAIFLIDNIGDHYSVNNVWLDKSGQEVPFETIKFPDIEEATIAFKKINPALIPKKVIVNDADFVQSSFLINNIELAYQSWKQNPWSANYDFKTFCEYILPYRSLTEPLENWRSEYKSIFEKSVVDLTDKTDPVELCSHIIKNIKYFDFVVKRFDPKPLLGPSELLFWRQGNCPDLANVALFASRSLGVAVTFDFTPHYAASSNRHFWNTVIDKNGKHIPFNGNQDLPYLYNPNNKRMAKVFRYTFSEQKQSLAILLPQNEIPADFLKNKNIIDVTNEYVEVSNFKYNFSLMPSSNIAYLNVFNKGAWSVIDWTKITKNQASFTNVGRNIVYLPGIYNSGKMKFEKHPVLLDVKGVQTTLKPDPQHFFKANLSRNNETKNDFKENNQLQILKSEKYKLYVYDDGWKFIEEQTASRDDLVSFSRVPKNGLFLMASAKPDFFERIFTVDSITSKITWY